jgi:arginase
MPLQPLSALQVIGVRYRGSRLALGDERALDAYAASGVYRQARVPVDVVEPAFPKDRREEEEADNLGLLGGAIADAVASARREGKAVLMTGGDCTHTTGVLGGLQDAHGPAARVGLVWFDAHGDFNTPKTSLSGMLGGMPVAVCAGLAYPRWRERSHIVAPLPTDRILLVDVRNLDLPEEQLIRATEVVVAAPAPGFPGKDLGQSVADLADHCDMLYLHIDADILDESFVPNHGTREPNGPNMEQVRAAIEAVMATGKVVAFAVVSVYGQGEGSEVSVASGIELIRAGLDSWRRHGLPGVAAPGGGA